MSSGAGETSVVRTIGRYRAFDELGRGAMGVVYRGFDPVIGRTVALKTLLLDNADAQAREFRDRLYREAAAAGALSHPNIVTIFDIIEDGNTTAVAMEFIEGRSLAAIIGERAPLPFDLAVDVFGQIASALDYAGSHGVVHRDIKPANILITPAGRVKVTDFGVARLALSTMTQAGTVLGSPSYMSPEQVRGLPLDGRSDLFSAAVVFYEMVTRERPFAGNDVATTMYRIAHEQPTPPGHFNAAIGPAVAAVLDRALAKNPNDRYQTGEQLAAELRRAANLGPAESGVPGPSAGIAAMAVPPPPPVPPLVMPAPAPQAVRQAPAILPLTVTGTPPVAVPTPPPAAAVPKVALPSLPVPLAAGPEESGPQLVPIPMSGVTPTAGSASGASLPALPPGAVAGPPAAAKPVAPKTGRPNRTMMLAGGAALLVIVIGAVTAGLMMRGGTGPTEAAPDDGVVAPQPIDTPIAEPALIPEPPPEPVPPPSTTPSMPPPAASAASGRPAVARPAPPKTLPAPASPKSGSGTSAPAGQPAARREATTRPAGEPAPRVYAATEVDERPQVLSQAPPAYPEDALRRRVEDVVVLKVLVGADGRPDQVEVLRGSAKSPSFDAAAVAAARRYQFSPARKGGQAVPCWFNLGVPFQLPRS